MGKNQEYIIGFDLGGTKMLSALFDRSYKIVARNKEKTADARSNEAVTERIFSCIDGLLKSGKASAHDILGIGIAIPGPIDIAAGIVLETPNLAMHNLPLRDLLEAKYDCPVILENDVNAGMYGEFKKGAARGFSEVVGLFPGTGVGGGLILGGKLYRGAIGGAGEIGHTIVQVDGPLCGCGKYGCLEAVASRTALAKDLVGLAANGEAPTVLEKAGTDIMRIKSSVIKKAIDAGEEKVIELVNRNARFLGIGMANCVNIFNPELLVLGGGLVEKLGGPYVRAAEASMREHAMRYLVKSVEVREAKLGDDAAVTGAAALLLESLNE